jgi:hypothetical protein
VSILQTALVFGGIPIGITLVIVVGVYGKSMLHQPNRYRPGRPWAYQPSWYVPHPDAVLAGHSPQPQLEGAATNTTAVGGAGGEW